MASLATNFTAFLFLFPVGVRRLLCSSSLYLRNPSNYKSKLWYFSDQKHKNIDLYFLIVFLPIASFSEFFFFLTFSGHPTYRFSLFMQSTLLFLFWAMILLILFRESHDSLLVNDSYVFAIAGILFLLEYIVIGKGIDGVGGVVYQLFGELSLICAASCFVLSVRPYAFFAEFLLSSGLIFKGTWLLQTGLSLYTDTFTFKGCHGISLVLAKGNNVDLRCDLEEDGLRGAAVANLLFVGYTVGVFIGCFMLFGLLSSFQNLRCGDAGGPLLAQLDSESSLMRPIPEFELE